MQRTAYHDVMPKTLYYRTNGTGRDTYIAYDNGGVFQSTSKYPNSQTGKYWIRPKSSYSRPSAKSLRYSSDGSGRDSYVKYGDGGLHAASTPRDSLSTFRESLRSNDCITMRKTISDPFSWAQLTWSDNRTRSISREKKRRVQDCVERLYYTKRSR
ncbi:unnamed protein product [Blepharisma stoltei]|uniref:Uncharacterized protein n=1 Tax=Blepharisma stoltei TaxID=1481888 RepID=A0AAU9JDR6_9CILI|nr:unnamed protein product [Blepharisma stoltei]